MDFPFFPLLMNLCIHVLHFHVKSLDSLKSHCILLLALVVPVRTWDLALVPFAFKIMIIYHDFQLVNNFHLLLATKKKQKICHLLGTEAFRYFRELSIDIKTNKLTFPMRTNVLMHKCRCK